MASILICIIHLQVYNRNDEEVYGRTNKSVSVGQSHEMEDFSFSGD